MCVALSQGNPQLTSMLCGQKKAGARCGMSNGTHGAMRPDVIEECGEPRLHHGRAKTAVK